MVIIRSSIFSFHSGIDFGFSTKIGLNRKNPYFFNTSLSVGDKQKNVAENRNEFYNFFKLTEENILMQKQTHSSNITFSDKAGIIPDNDALITNVKKIGLVVSSADCCPVFIYEKKEKVIAAIHSGWRGTQKEIVRKTVEKMKKELNCNPFEMIVYIGPSINQVNYEVGEEVATLFSEKYLKKQNGKIFLDVTGANYDMLIESGISKESIQKSNLCSYEMENLLHSYRRDGNKSGRAFGLIVMK